MYPDTPNLFPSSQRAASVEAAFDCITELFSGFERIVELNVQTVKTSLSEQQALADAGFSARSLSEVIDLHSQLLPAAVKKSFAYLRHFEDIVVETGNGFFTAMYAHPGGFMKRLEEMTGIAAGGPAVLINKANRIVTGEPAVAEPVTIVDSAGNVLSSGDVRSDLH
ncbi:MAG: phasin family protein [Paraburkholderia sp.]|uniref:phasin family protein n=1 Tax=Paraburkholderia sp. TaxID=1926495 RepID=UPI003C55BE16